MARSDGNLPSAGSGRAAAARAHAPPGGANRDGHAVRDLLRDSGIVLLDLDGCLAFGNQPHPAAGRLLDLLRGRYAILSNNSTETPQGLSDILGAQGLAVEPERIFLAGSLMVDLLAARAPERPIYLMGSPELHAYARARGLDLCAESAGTVALARDTALAYGRLNGALRLLHAGADLVVSNPDLTHPGADRDPVLETGALLAALRACLPALEPTIVGKPGAALFEAALARFRVAASDAVMVGDNPETDGVGAARAGIAALLVGPGNPLASIADLLP